MTTSLSADLDFHRCAGNRFLYYVTDEEDRFLLDLGKLFKDRPELVNLYSPAMGLVNLVSALKSWHDPTIKAEPTTKDADKALRKIRPLVQEECCWVFTDPERLFRDALIVRLILDLIHVCNHAPKVGVTVIFLGPRITIPASLERYLQVVRDPGISKRRLENLVGRICREYKVEPPADLSLFRDMSTYEIRSAIGQSAASTVPESRVDPQYVTQLKSRRLLATGLVTLVKDVASLDDLGGADRFKSWAQDQKATWSPEGQKQRLVPPRGLILLGFWGCGKSLSARALAGCWQLPLFELDFGRLRERGLGDSEGNVRKAIDILEASAPALVWIDEAERNLSGDPSSTYSDAGTTSRMHARFATWLQETKASLCFVFTVNNMAALPVAFVRRSNERFFFGPPTPAECLEILKIHLRKHTSSKLTNIECSELMQAAHGLVGSEIEQSINDALLQSYLKQSYLIYEVGVALTNRPRLLRAFSREAEALHDWIGYDPIARDGVRARYASSLEGDSNGSIVERTTDTIPCDDCPADSSGFVGSPIDTQGASGPSV
jgi:hypothetical protein